MRVRALPSAAASHIAALLVVVATGILPGLLAARILAPSAAEAWRNVAGDGGRLVELLANSAIAVSVVLAIDLPLGFALGFLLFRTDVGGRRTALGLLGFAAALPLHVTLTAWLPRDPSLLTGSAAAVGCFHALVYLPLTVLLCGLGTWSAASDEERLALTLGASPLRVAAGVVLRRCARFLCVTALLLGLWTATDYTVSDVLQVRTFAEEVYTRFASDARLEEPAILALPQILACAALLAVLLRIDAPPHGAARHPYRFDLRRARPWISAATCATACALVLVPLGRLLLRMDDPTTLLDTAREMQGEIATTAATAAAAALVCAWVAGPVAAWVRASSLARTVALGWAVLLLALPPPVAAMGLIHALNRPGVFGAVYDSPAVLVLAYVLRFLPVAVLLVIPAALAIPADLVRAARTEGCGPLAVYAHVAAPHCVRARVAAGLVVAILSLGELAASLLVAPPGFQTIGARYFGLIHYGLYGRGAALCTLSALMVWVPCAALLRIGLRGRANA